MDREKIMKFVNSLVYFLFTVLGILMFFSIALIEAGKKPLAERQKILAEWSGVREVNSNYPTPWPPEMNKAYPDIALIDQNGNSFTLASFKGKVVVVEMVDMTSPISQAYSGAKTKGTYGSGEIKIDEFATDFSELVSKETQGTITLPSKDIVLVKIIFFNDRAEQAKPEDAQMWAQHFGYKREDNMIVAVPQKDLRGKVSDKLIPGFQLIDKNFLLRVDSAGPEPKHNLQFRLLPMVSTLVNQ